MYNYLASLDDTFPVHPGGQGQGKNIMFVNVVGLLVVLFILLVLLRELHLSMKLDEEFNEAIRIEISEKLKENK